MPIDSRIALGIQTPQPPNTLAQLAQVMQIRQAQDAGRLSDLQYQQQQQVQGVLSQARTPEEAIPMLMKAGPLGVQQAQSLAQLLKQTDDAKAASEKRAFFSPENRAKFVGGGRPAVTLPEDVSGPVMPEQPGQMNFPKFLQAAAERGVIPPETYANHLAQREQARATMAQTAQLRREAMEQQVELARQRSEDQALSRAEQNKARMDMIRLSASLRAPPVEQPLQAIVGPDGKPVLVPRSQAVGRTPYTASSNPERALPSSLANKYLENIQNLRKAETAVTLLAGEDIGDVKGDKEATGRKGLLTNLGVIGDKTLNWWDPAGVDTRAAIGDLGSMVIHDRSGAAVTAAEFPRLRPFIPLASDSPEVARKKVKRFAQEYRAEVEAQQEFFTASGYKVPNISGSRRAGDGASGQWLVVK